MNKGKKTKGRRKPGRGWEQRLVPKLRQGGRTGEVSSEGVLKVCGESFFFFLDSYLEPSLQAGFSLCKAFGSGAWVPNPAFRLHETVLIAGVFLLSPQTDLPKTSPYLLAESGLGWGCSVAHLPQR